MPIFVSNYEEIISNQDPDPKMLKFNSPQNIMSRFEDAIANEAFRYIDNNKKSYLRKMTYILANKLNAQNVENFTFGPAYSLTVLYDSQDKETRVFVTYTPFGGGSTETLGADKISETEEKKLDPMLKRFYSPESMANEKALDEIIARELVKSSIT